MAKTWVLDTETKGTGANMVPLEKTLRQGGREADLALVDLKRPPREEQAPEPRPGLEFKVLDVMTNQVVAERASARATVEALGRFRSVVDVLIYVWDADGSRWRMLTLDEQRALWRHRHAEAA